MEREHLRPFNCGLVRSLWGTASGIILGRNFLQCGQQNIRLILDRFYVNSVFSLKLLKIAIKLNRILWEPAALTD
jgi:hypothetical protein